MRTIQLLVLLILPFCAKTQKLASIYNQPETLSLNRISSATFNVCFLNSDSSDTTCVIDRKEYYDTKGALIRLENFDEKGALTSYHKYYPINPFEYLKCETFNREDSLVNVRMSTIQNGDTISFFYRIPDSKCYGYYIADQVVKGLIVKGSYYVPKSGTLSNLEDEQEMRKSFDVVIEYK